MPEREPSTTKRARFDDPALKNLVADRIDVLRKRLLDFTRRNPLIHVAFRPTSATLIRVVDELPDMIRLGLSDGEMRLAALPPLDEDPRDELNDRFQDALFIARGDDPDYLAALEKLDPNDPKALEIERQLERGLKDKVRVNLGLPPLPRKDALSLVEHARAHGINPAFDLPRPSDHHGDGRDSNDSIQTLLTPERLRRAGKTILTRGQSIEREIGVNVQHAVLGFLEWKNPEEKETWLSPLLLMEINVSRQAASSGEEYHVNGSSVAATNTTLREKLITEFRLDLPPYESGSLEDYFDLVQAKAPPGWLWRVRRQVVFGIFPSSRMAMYHDLNPELRLLTEKPLVMRLMASAGGGGPGDYAPDYEPDGPEYADVAPLVVRDADASQWSAVVDVLRGQDVAIEGPPGSGKSQTIVNIIAACLAEGKRVLFVAEKLTALDVVKSRIEAVGLGEFVLPLQAGKSSSETVYESISTRLQIRPEKAKNTQTDFSLQKALFENRKSQLQGYLDVLGQPFGSVDRSVHEILGRAIKTSHLRDVLPRDLRRFVVPMIDRKSRAELEALISDAGNLSRALASTNAVPNLWMEASSDVTTREQAEDLAVMAEELVVKIQYLQQKHQSSALGADGADAWATTTFSEIARMLEEVEAHRRLFGAKALSFLVEPDNRTKALSLSKTVALLGEVTASVNQLFSDPTTSVDIVERAILLARENGGRIDPVGAAHALELLKQEASDVEKCIKVFKDLGPQWEKSSLSIGVIEGLRNAIQTARPEVVALSGLGSIGEITKCIVDFEAERGRMRRSLEEISVSLKRAGNHPLELVLRTADTIEGAGFFASLGHWYREAVKVYTDEFGGRSGWPKALMVRTLRNYAQWLRERDTLNDPAMRARFGSAFCGYETQSEFLLECRDHVDAITQILLPWPTLCSEVLKHGGQRLLTVNVYGLPADMDAPGANAASAKLSKDFVAASRRVAEVKKMRSVFVGSGALTNASLEKAKETIEIKERLTGELGRISIDLPEEIVAQNRNISVVADAIVRLIAVVGRDRAMRMIKGNEVDLSAQAFRHLAAAQTAVVQARDSLASAAGLSKLPTNLVSLAEVIPDLSAASREPLALLDRAALRRAETRLRNAGLDPIVEWAIGDGRDKAIVGFDGLISAIIDKSLVDAVYALHGTALNGYSGAELNHIRKEIKEKDRAVIDLSRQVIRAKVLDEPPPPGGVSVGRKSEWTEMALIRNELAKVRRRLPIRELTRRSWRSLIALKPCWMMSPLAVSQFLPMQAQFDVIIIDEASQMTPENALGAISRAKQAVIVGDTKQLPPTSFFARAIDDSDVDEDLREDSESILDLANLVFTPMRQLRWHYRSQHADLIRFSNHWMYDDKLTIFPSAESSHAGLGVEIVRVDGVYKSQLNAPEARKVVDAAIRFMRENPGLSLGICTMNTKQRDLIDEEIDRERERNPHVQNYISDWETRNDGLERFFVKNLEAIQGDERDVMFISTLYGPESLGAKTHQRFGPINTSQGHRRLNVLFTRAKKKIVTFSSMDAADILDSEDKSKGVKMLRNWLEYSQTGQLGERVGNVGGYESPFEEHVAVVVEALGYEVVPQVGTAGYRVDLGIRHADWPHGYIAGIECDGASYHSSRSARDRDRLREEILNGLGWTLHRIWSTDWFSNPYAERDRVEEFLKKRLADLKSLPVRQRVSSFNEVLARPITAAVPRPISAPAVQRPQQLELTTAAKSQHKRVLVGSKVVVSQDGIERTYRISPSQNDPANGILSKDAPLAKAMLDLEEGDDFEFSAGSLVRSASVVKII